MTTEYHQPAIDGLRALAITVVVLYHVGIEPLSGGSIGFATAFVVSGYLLTSRLADRLDLDRSVLWGQYLVRRVERILPALVVSVLVATVVVRWALAPEAREGAADGFRAGLLLFGNWHLIAESTGPIGAGVPAGAAQHLWAVAVLAQFTLLWPLVLTGLYRSGRRLPWSTAVTVRIGVLILALASAGASLWLAGDHEARALYGTDTRAHQFLLGAMLAVVPHQVQRFLRHQRLVAGGLGLLAVVALGVLASDVVAIGPVQRGMAAALATLVVVAAIERSDGTLRRSLRANPLPYLGRLAHGTYVWHWPVFVVIGALAPDAQPYQLAILTLLLGLGLAALTHELVERPIQSQERFGLARSALAASVVVMGLFVGAVLAPPALDAGVRSGAGTEEVVDPFTRVPADLDLDAERLNEALTAATVDCIDQPVDDCTVVEGEGAHLVLLGDGLAIPLVPALEQVARARGLTLSVVVVPGCPWQKGVDFPNRGALHPCDTATADVYGRILPELDPDVVVVSSGFLTLTPGVTEFDPADSLAVDLRAQTLATVDDLRSIADHILLIDPMPVASLDPLACLATADWLEDCRFVADDSGLWLEEYYRSVAEARPGVVVADFDPEVCPYLPICDPVIAGQVVRLDAQHLTQDFGATLAEPIEALLDDNGMLVDT